MAARNARTARQEDDRELADIPMLAGAAPATLHRLSSHVDRVELPPGAVVVEAGQPVHWVAVATWGELVATGHHPRRWPRGAACGLPEALTHGVAATGVVTAGPARVVFIEARALTAAIALDPAVGLSVARALVRQSPAPLPSTGAARHVRRRHRVVPAGGGA